MKFKYLPILIASFLIVSCTQKQPVLYMVGDSTMADKERLDLPERGWGQVLPNYFDTSFTIENHAQNGRSTRSFIYEGRWDSVMNKLKPGDFVIIQFGHNDDKESKLTRYTTHEEFKYNFTKYVKDTKSKGAFPIVATPIIRRNWINDTLVETHGIYPDIIREVAEENNVPLIELHLKSRALVDSLGEEASAKIYQHYEPGDIETLPNGKHDNTHFCKYGADVMAKIAVEEINKKVPELAKYLKKE